ncbi:hypothetical protein [Lyngbya sp. CCY1209]|uniref:hypothetical protein n=1 Tax=Lyngbya sp. CCY1209 TaxID=2886103 RepID=UPI002D207150|nr:hypothetical protein [Lyngbya sp. CCY1209]MEB3882807.1 hypothetical protein [Lyngbya sp. CCY1209]
MTEPKIIYYWPDGEWEGSWRFADKDGPPDDEPGYREIELMPGESVEIEGDYLTLSECGTYLMFG